MPTETRTVHTPAMTSIIGVVVGGITVGPAGATPPAATSGTKCGCDCGLASTMAVCRKCFRQGYRGETLAAVAEAQGMSVLTVASGTGTQFIPAGIRWVVERSFAWLSRYRRKKEKRNEE
jgi:transposase